MLKHINWTSANIATWNKTTFKNNTVNEQIRRVAEEIREWREAKTKQHKLEELADVFIASSGLTRFGGNIGEIGSFMCYILQVMDSDGDKKGQLKNAVNSKMLINIERTFDERMHHIER